MVLSSDTALPRNPRYSEGICLFRLRFARSLSLERERFCLLELDQRLGARTLVVWGCLNKSLKGSEHFGVSIFRFSLVELMEIHHHIASMKEIFGPILYIGGGEVRVP